ncbi:uncharacterized protein [Montipora capricornis]|uniref:uncharacterized protein n=1 Tax=Montipora capricornis TaxID=246305 RepID=UPI0035F1EFE1
MNDNIAEGHAPKLTIEEASITGFRTWYLRHFAVTNCNKPNKVRIVFDAAAEHKGTSLNKNLLPGPDYTNSLVDVLLRFREEKVALVGDIKSMFHQVKVRPEDQDSLRFLWWSGSLDETPNEYAMTVHIFGATDSPCSVNFALLRTAEDNWKEFDPVTVFTLRDNYYVDDLLKSMPTPEQIGYGTCTYPRIVYPDGTVECAFITGKSTNAPIKTVSIPRLELQGALLAARVDVSVRKELNFEFERVVFWTDSMITLNYIYSESRGFQTYVANRVTEIRELTSPEQWRHCPGKLNPADDVSRGLEMKEFQNNDRWLNGPSFLWKTEDHWPEIKHDEVAVDKLEMKKEVYLIEVETATPLDNLLTRYSRWITLLRSFAWLLKFVKWLKWSPKEKKR